MNKRDNNQLAVGRAGYTLIEALIYVTILAVVIGAVLVLIIGALRLHTGVSINRDFQVAANSFDRLVREIKSAESVDWTASQLGVSAGSLTLISGFDGRELTFGLDDQDRLVLIAPESTDRLIPRTVAVTTLVFNRLETVNSEGVKVSATFSSHRQPSRTETVGTSAILRSSY